MKTVYISSLKNIGKTLYFNDTKCKLIQKPNGDETRFRIQEVRSGIKIWCSSETLVRIV